MGAKQFSEEFLRRSQMRQRAALTVREVFPDRLKRFGALSAPEISRARQDGAGLLAVLKYVNGVRDSGAPREVAELFVECIRDEIEALWGSDPRSPIELCANEQAANSEEDEASMTYILAPTDANARRLLIADEKHRAIKQSRAAALLRHHTI